MRYKILYFYMVAIIVGMLTGVAGSYLILAVHEVNRLISGGFAYVLEKGWSVGWASAIVSMLMVYVSWLMVKHIAPEAAGSGVQEIEGTLENKRPIHWLRLLPVKFFGGILALSSQLVVGREGPTIQIGGNLGAMVSSFFKFPTHERDALISAGAAAGLATAFNAPLAGMLFILEEMRGKFKFTYTNFSGVTIACVVSVIFLHCIIGSQPAIEMTTFKLPSIHSLWFFLLFGLIVGFVGLLFNVTLMKSLTRTDKFQPRTRRMFVLSVGALIGYTAYAYPDMVGGGYLIIERSLEIYPSFSMVLIWVVIRFILTMLSYNVGTPGGIFAPMLALGTLLGIAMAHAIFLVEEDGSIHYGMFAVAGMGALFAAVVRAPVTGIVLVVEMTQNYSMILPLMVTCLTATKVVELTGTEPIYTQLLDRTLRKQAALTAEPSQ